LGIAASYQKSTESIDEILTLETIRSLINALKYYLMVKPVFYFLIKKAQQIYQKAVFLQHPFFRN